MLLIGSENKREVGIDHSVVKRPHDGNHDAGDDGSFMKWFVCLRLCVHSFSTRERSMVVSVQYVLAISVIQVMKE